MRRLVGFGTGGLKSVAYAAALVLIGGAMFSVAAMSKTSKKDRQSSAARHSQELFKEGRDVFRNETFGDE
jgi:hypothetical protein